MQKTTSFTNDKFFMIYNCFSFNYAINCNDNCRIICSKTKICPLNITFLQKILYRIVINSMKNLFNFFQNKNFRKEISPKNVCFRMNHWLLLIKKHRNYSKYNDLFYTLNVYKITGKEHQVVDFWVTDEVLASEILFWKYLEYAPLI